MEQIVNGNGVLRHNTVRRLTPVECERLQGFPDNHTKVPFKDKPIEDCPDGHRYRALGNSMAVPVMRWLGERVVKALLPVHISSFSGGRTSAYMVKLLEEKAKAEHFKLKHIFMDTGAEHPKTYEFIRQVVKYWNIDLTCLRLVINPELGKANTYKIVSVDEIGHDLQPWIDACSKYGTPYLSGPFCTRTMKLEPFERYCKEQFGAKYHTWLGIRADEPSRLKAREGVSYLSDISEFDKQDITNWWRNQPFDLDIPEHLGNCIFCIKKGVNKIALATRDEPKLAQHFLNVINDKSVRTVKRRQQENKIMYRGNHSLENIIMMYADKEYEEISGTIRGMKGYDSESCSESCEIYNCEDNE
ncbi:MAG: DNA cytosine methyltransferase [Providencia sp.]|uniref:DNA cytosine methyltransferase n=1 Tax=Providencia sp. TaxID=589 RepID=UPI003F956EC9